MKLDLKAILARKDFILWAVFVLMGLAVALHLSTAPAPQQADAPPPSSLETFIPKGHLLIPIEVANAERLEGVLGENGIVDLYQPAAGPGSRAKLVGKRLRLLRAPMNPQSFAVLLKDSEVDQFLSSTGPYIASVRPLNEAKHEVARAVGSGPQIDYFQEVRK